MLGVSPLLAQVWFFSLVFLSELVVSCVKLNNIKQKYLGEVTRSLLISCFLPNSSNNTNLSPFTFSYSPFPSSETALELAWGRVLAFSKPHKICIIVTIVLVFVIVFT